MSDKKVDPRISIGGVPRIDLLPLEVKQRKNDRKFRHRLMGMLAIVLAICVAGYFVAAAAAAAGQSQLESAKSMTAALLKEQGNYVEAKSAATSANSARAGALVGSAYEILWRDYILDLEKRLPDGVKILQFAIDSQNVLEPVIPSTVPLERDRVSTFSFKAVVPGYREAKEIIAELRELPGWSDSSLTAVDSDGGIFKASFVVHINSAAFERRFFEVKDPAAKPAEETGEDASAPTPETSPSPEGTTEEGN